MIVIVSLVASFAGRKTYIKTAQKPSIFSRYNLHITNVQEIVCFSIQRDTKYVQDVGTVIEMCSELYLSGRKSDQFLYVIIPIEEKWPKLFALPSREIQNTYKTFAL